MNELLSEYISTAPDAKVIVLFGGNPHKRDMVVKDLSTIPRLTIYGTRVKKKVMRRSNRYLKQI